VLNRRERLDEIMQRDGAVCIWCGRHVDTGLVRATTEHVVPRSKGGPSWIENELAACSRCNSDRGHRGLAEFADECEALGLTPDRGALVEALARLERAIHERGGQRRARRYLDHQLRRLRNQLA
jgi:5-methylcytosine-specific restriction endonuclease McrA